MLPKDINNITEPVYKRLHKELEGKPQVVNVDNVNNLSDDVLNNLKAGDVIRKKTGNQYHSYRVSYKEDGQGICLTYCDASLVETVSYDYIDGHWVYNSTDSTDISAELPDTSEASAGDLLKLDSKKKPVWGAAPAGGTKLYLHTISLKNSSFEHVYYGDKIGELLIISNNSQSFNLSKLGIFNNQYRYPFLGGSADFTNKTFNLLLRATVYCFTGSPNAIFRTESSFVNLKENTRIESTYVSPNLIYKFVRYTNDSIDITTGNIISGTKIDEYIIEGIEDTVTEL